MEKHNLILQQYSASSHLHMSLGSLLLTMFLFHRRLEQSPGLLFPHHFTVVRSHLSLWGHFRVIIKAVWTFKQAGAPLLFSPSWKTNSKHSATLPQHRLLKLSCCFFIVLEILNTSNIKYSICSHTLSCIASIKSSHNIWWCCVWVWYNGASHPLNSREREESKKEMDFSPRF